MAKQKRLPLVLLFALVALAVGAYAQSTTKGRVGQGDTGKGPTNLVVTLPSITQGDIHRISESLEKAGAHPNAEERQRAKDELAAQQDTAFFAKVMLWIAGAETVVTFVGVVLVALTLIAAVRSARAAEDTVKETRRIGDAQLEELRAQFELNRQEFVSTHRPKIILRGAIVSTVREGEKISVYFILANVGETWGKIVRSVVDLEVVQKEPPGRLGLTSLEPFNEIGELELAPGQAQMIGFDQLHKRDKSAEAPTWKENSFIIKSILDVNEYGQRRTRAFHDPVIHLVGQFLYEDRQGLRRRTAFRRELNPERGRFYHLEGEPDLDYSD